MKTHLSLLSFLAILSAPNPGNSEPISRSQCGSHSASIHKRHSPCKDSLVVATVLGFYSKVRNLSGEGIPQPEELDSLQPYLTKQLFRMLRIAHEKQNSYLKKADAPVPPIVEGSLFCSAFEGFSDIEKVYRDSAKVNEWNVAFVFREAGTDSGPAEAVSWVDRIHVKRERHRWVIDDISYLGGWEFGLKGSLRAVLRFIVKKY